MTNYRTKSKAELKEIVLINNIKIGTASGKYGQLLKEDYLIAVIKNTGVNVIPRRKINSCDWLLNGSLEKCSRPRAKKDVYCCLHVFRIRQGKSKPVACKRCKMGTKSSINICTKCVIILKITLMR